MDKQGIEDIIKEYLKNNLKLKFNHTHNEFDDVKYVDIQMLLILNEDILSWQLLRISDEDFKKIED